MRVFLDCGGAEFTIQVSGVKYRFEMHPWCGPNILNRRGEPLKRQPRAFLIAASLWAQQGQRVENGLCVWDHEPEPIVEHLGGRNYKLLGFKPAARGE